MSKKVVIMGAGGRMGRTLIRCLLEKRFTGLELCGAVDLWDAEQLGMDAGWRMSCLQRVCDVQLGADRTPRRCDY